MCPMIFIRQGFVVWFLFQEKLFVKAYFNRLYWTLLI